jgi:hypothetical protein
MTLFEKNLFKSSNGIEVGYILKLKDKIGLESDSKDFEQLIKAVAQLKNDYKSSVILVDTNELIRWDTYGLRAVIPTLLDINSDLASKGRPPVCIIGDTTRDIHNAVVERWADKAKQIPWVESEDAFRKKYSI